MFVSAVPAWNLSPCARWPLLFFAPPACIFHLVSPPAWSFRLSRHGICLHMPAGCSRSLSSRRAFFILILRRHGRLDGGGEEFVSFCPLALPFFAMPACIFYSVSPPACIFHPITPPARPFRLCRRGICLRVPAGRSHSPSSRRAFFILYLRRHGRFAGDGEEFATLCPVSYTHLDVYKRQSLWGCVCANVCRYHTWDAASIP